jgi:GT2 family glycosyltransferase
MIPSADEGVLFIVPTLGQRADLLRQALLSVERSGHPVDLVVVTPHGSPAVGIAAEIGARVVHDPGRGLSAALNAGLVTADLTCPYFGWLGDDDLLRPGALRATVMALQAQPEAVMVYGWCDYVDEDGRTFFVSRAGRWAARVIGFGPDLIPQPGSLMRLEAVQAVGGLDENLDFAMDLDLFLKLRSHGQLTPIRRTLAAFRWHADSLTVGNQKKSVDEADMVRKRYLNSVAAATWPLWRWPVRWSLAAIKVLVKRRAAAISSRKFISAASP